MRNVRRNRAPFVAALLLLSLPVVAAVSTEQPYGVPEAPGSQGKLKKVVRPDYPQAALARGAKATIDVDGVVDPMGFLRDVRLQPVSGDAAEFVPALQAVVPHWEFNPPLGDDCMPSAERVRTRVEFEVDAGKPRIYLTQPARAAAADLKPSYMIAPAYPRSMFITGTEAKVYTRAMVDTAGHVGDVSTKVVLYPPATSMAYQNVNVDSGDFVDQTTRAVRLWTYPPGASRVVCQVFSFRLAR